jgi:hypothetical protein
MQLSLRTSKSSLVRGLDVDLPKVISLERPGNRNNSVIVQQKRGLQP